ncbi:MAG: DUF723 domain-containing protein [bacterium]|nr:DUF723 domain-containing protein [bacterium]
MKRDEKGKALPMNTEEYLKSLPEHHRNTFDYSESVYSGSDEPITFICPTHGEQTYPKARKHKISPHGCKECGKGALYKKKAGYGEERFYKIFTEKYGDTYDLSYTRYEKSKTSCDFFCLEHGLTQDKPCHAVKRHPCKKCRSVARSLVNRKPPDVVIEESFSRFGKKFEFDFTNYISSKSIIMIKCPTHGWDDVRLSNHLNSNLGCSKCFQESEKTAWNAVSKETSLSVLDYIYKGKYHFFTEDIGKANDYVRYYCPRHHHFHKTQLRHLKDGFACDKCGDEVMAEKLTGFYTVKRIERDKDFYQKDYNTLYIMKLSDGVYKIGIAKHPKTRLCSVRTQSKIESAELVSVFEGTTYECFYLEKYFHTYFNDKRFKFDHVWKGHTEVFELTYKELNDVLSTTRFELKEDVK